MWSFTPTKSNVYLFNDLKDKFDQEDAVINRSAFINRALDEIFGRMNKAVIKEMMKAE